MLTFDLTALGLTDGLRVLDLGCGAGRHLHAAYYAAKIEAFGLDRSFEDIEKTRAGFRAYPDTAPGAECRFRLVVGDCVTLPFAPASFDIIICSEVLEHLLRFELALAEIARVLKPMGRLAVSVPRFWPEWLCWRLAQGYHTTPGGHLRIFKPQDLRKAIERAGFRFERRHFAHGLHSPYWWLQCLVWAQRDKHPLVKIYHRFLVWDIMKRPWLTRVLAAIADPIMGKSLVLYFSKEAA
jgi:SAM-dependent methyltransferase